MQIIWKDIQGYEGLYQVSNYGKVKRLERLYDTTGRKQHRKEKLLNLYIFKSGYIYVTLTKNNIQKKYTVHRLVAMAFIENENKKPTVNHINYIKSDNRVENLEWSTMAENNQHAWDNGLKENARKSCSERMKRLDGLKHFEKSNYNKAKYAKQLLANKQF